MRQELKNRVTRLHSNITPEQVDTFLFNHPFIKQTENAKETISKLVQALAVTRYGKKPESSAILSCASLIVRNFERSLSIYDLKYVFNQCSSGSITFELTDRYFAATSVIKLLRKYEGMKQIIKRAYFDLKKENGQDEEGKQNEHVFTQQALKKFHEGERLTFYEKSTVGRFYLNSIPQTSIESMNEMVTSETVRLRKERQRKENANPYYPYEAVKVDGERTVTLHDNEETPYEPLFITEKMVFGNLLFDFVVENEIHRKAS